MCDLTSCIFKEKSYTPLKLDCIYICCVLVCLDWFASFMPSANTGKYRDHFIVVHLSVSLFITLLCVGLYIKQTSNKCM